MPATMRPIFLACLSPSPFARLFSLPNPSLNSFYARPFFPSRVYFTCRLFASQAIRIYIYMVSVYDAHYCNKIIDHPSSHLRAQFRSAYLHLLFHNRCLRDEIIINSQLPCRFFFAAIYNSCNARYHGSL